MVDRDFSGMAIRRWSNPLAHAAASDRTKERWGDQQWRNHVVGVLKEQWQDPLVKAERLKAMVGARDYSDPDYREKQRSAATGRNHSSGVIFRLSEMKGGLRNKALPLLMREGLIQEVASITGFESIQIKRLQADERRRKQKMLTGYSLEQERLTRSRSQKRRWQKAHGFVDGKDEQNDLRFARRLFQAGFFTTDLSDRDELVRVYKEEGRELPEDFANQLRLEVLLNGLKNPQLGTRSTYERLGEEIDEEWFKLLSKEEMFIINATADGRKFLTERIFQEFYHNLYTTAFAIAKNRQEAEDIIGRLCLKWSKNGLENFPLRGAVEEKKSYLIRASRNESLSYLRGERKGGVVFVSIDPQSDNKDVGSSRNLALPVDDVVFEDMRAAALAQAAPLNTLHHRGWSVGELAEEVGVNINTMKTRMRREREEARKTLAVWERTV